MSDATPPRPALRWTIVVLALAAAITLVPLAMPIALAAWTAGLARPLARRLERVVGKRRVASVMTLALLLVVLVPLGLAVASLVVSGIELVSRAAASDQVRIALQSLVSEGGGDVGLSDILDPRRAAQLIGEHGAEAWSIVKAFAGTTAGAVVQLFVYIIATQLFLADGEVGWAWLVDRAPLAPPILGRLRATFYETGRGLIIGVGGTALIQGTVAAVAYTAVGVPRALTLAQLTFFAAFIPMFGTALVWVPIAAGLALTGQLGRALILAGIGALVISTIDNILRPVLARWGRLDLPVAVQILAVFGGFSVFGAWGFLLGPLLVRMAKEALDIARDEGLVGRAG